MNRTSFRRAIVPGIAALRSGPVRLRRQQRDRRRRQRLGRHRQRLACPATLNGARRLLAGEGAGGLVHRLPGRSTTDVTINYDPIGSGDGRTNFIERRRQLRRLRLLPQRRRGRAHRRQGALRRRGPDRGPGLRLADRRRRSTSTASTRSTSRADTIAQIFDGKITNWNDPAIAAENAGASCPTWPSRRSTAPTTRAPRRTSPTTSARPARRWTYEAEDAFPVEGGEAADGTSGVVAA